MSRHWSRRALLRAGGASLTLGAASVASGRGRDSVAQSAPGTPDVGWQRVYGDAEVATVQAITDADIGYALLCGMRGGDPPALIRASDGGELIDMRPLPADASAVPSPLDLVTADDGYTALLRVSADGGTRALVFEVGGDLEYRWRQRVGPDGADFQPRSVARDGDGLVVAGAVINEATNIDAYVARLGPDGTVDWERTLAPQRVTAGISILVEDEGYSLAGGTAETPENLAAGQPPVEGWLARLGPEGQLEWQRRYSTSTPDGTTNAQTLFSDHARTDEGYLLVGGAATQRGGTETARMLAAPPDGERTWDFRYAAEGDRASALRAVTRDGDTYYVAGRVGEQSGTDALGLALAVTVAGGAATQWDRPVATDDGGRFLDVAASPDGAGVYAGAASVAAEEAGWLVGLGASNGTGATTTTTGRATPTATPTPTERPTTRPDTSTPFPDGEDDEGGGPPIALLGGAAAAGGLLLAGVGLLRWRGGSGDASGDPSTTSGGSGTDGGSGATGTASGAGPASGTGGAGGAGGGSAGAAGAGTDQDGVDGDLLAEATAVATDGPVERHAATLPDGTEAELAVLAERYADDEAAATALIEAGRQWNGISQNPHVATVYETADQPRPWIAFDPGDGALETLVDDLDRGERIDVVRDAAEAVRTAGMYNVVHGSIEPGTVYVAPTGATLADWGTTREVADAIGDSRVTPYTAPEQLDGGTAAVHTDIYRLGALAYRLLADAPPYPSGTDLETAIEAGEYTPPSDVGDVSQALETVVETAMATDPEDRYDSAYEFRAALNGAVDS